ncbi:ABC transporter ATP-binding protein [Rhizobium oryziradicis]|uniref:ABC transporter n=1 Tax=Rhizobium oryziradicis TaxID=1867956 RepID=A0A1Q8ZWG9_9HYPH|nr:ABC transporter ATP-binding protein [Rhizobium oryziradicis]OLP46413.1 ABC transporter [Rhizobium oryziradicis]
MANPVEIRGLKVEAKTDANRRIEIVKGIDLDIAPGEILALIGESGSGKTTIALTLMGHTRTGCTISAGSVMVDGQDVVSMTERERAKLRGAVVSYVPQSAALAFNPSKTIMDQVIEVTQIHAIMPAQDARQKAIELFRALSLPNPDTIGERYPHQVSGGQLQRLAAAMALIANPKVVIFDEPTTALDVTTQIEVLRAFKDVMRRAGAAAIYVSHDLAVVAQLADRIAVLRNGAVQEIGDTVQILERAQHPYTRELIAAFEPHRAPMVLGNIDQQRPLLEVENVVAGYGRSAIGNSLLVKAVDHVSLKLYRGRNLGIVGESGCGKSTLARTISGILPAAEGNIIFDGRELGAGYKERTAQQKREMQIVFQYADAALNPSKTIDDILGRPLAFYHGLKGEAQSKRINGLLDMVQLPTSVRGRRPSELSGGQKQRVNFARALAAEPKLIICDEVTSALDTVVVAAVIDLLRELQQELGLSYIFISHDLSVVQAICDKVIVMYRGKAVEELAVETMTEPSHPYSQLLFSSVPKLDPHWLDSLPAERPAFHGQ